MAIIGKRKHHEFLKEKVYYQSAAKLEGSKVPRDYN